MRLALRHAEWEFPPVAFYLKTENAVSIVFKVSEFIVSSTDARFGVAWQSPEAAEATA